jgi:TetR/AcrR family transcriptional repressor of nem operon
MRYPPTETAERHERILDAASRRFRRNGFAGVNVAEVMSAAGLTHGAFYAHFESKNALAAAAVDRALGELLAHLARAATASDPADAFVTNYLSLEHRNNVEQGCAAAALGAEIARDGGKSRSIFTRHLQTILANMTKSFWPRAETGDSRAKAIHLYSTLVGAILLARAVDDPILSEEILEANRHALMSVPQEPRAEVPIDEG